MELRGFSAMLRFEVNGGDVKQLFLSSLEVLRMKTILYLSIYLSLSPNSK